MDEIFSLIAKEEKRQKDVVNLIASENYVSEEINRALGSCLTNKYSEGYPQKRYYGGCDIVDEIERITIQRACELFGADHANVQPHSGSQANAAAYFALLKPGDTVVGMDLSAGGHLTHGSPVNMSGRFYKFFLYGVDEETGLLDYDKILALALECQPKLIVCGASAYPRLIDYARFREIADRVGAMLMVDIAHIAGQIAAKIIPSPVPYADVVTATTHKTLRGPRGGLILCREQHAKAIDRAVFPGTQGGPLQHVIAAKGISFGEAMQPEFVEYQKQIQANALAMADVFRAEGVKMVTGGTDNHLLVLDLRGTGRTGLWLEQELQKRGIIVNKEMVPGDPEKPAITSGIRIGTPAVTTLGYKESDCRDVAKKICDVIKDRA